jgi:hypothetical protein
METLPKVSNPPSPKPVSRWRFYFTGLYYRIPALTGRNSIIIQGATLSEIMVVPEMALPFLFISIANLQ